MTIFQVITRNEQLKARIEKLDNMSDHCRRHPNDLSGFARIKRLKSEIYDQMERNLQNVTAE